MKLLMFAPIYPPQIGGPATQCHSLCRALFTRGHKPVVLTPGEGFSRTSPDGFPVYRYPWKYTGTFLDKPLRWIVFTPTILYVILRERPHILHSHSVSAPSFIAVVISKLFGMPSIIKFAGDWVWETLSTPKVRGKDFEELYASTWSGRFLRRVERFGVSLYTKVWAPSKFRAKNIRELLGTDAKTVHIPNSLILPAKGNRPRASGFVVVSANRFIPHKQIPAIVRAFAKADIPESRLVLIGGGQDGEKHLVENEIKRLNLMDRVRLTGILSSPEVYEEFERASVYISASLEEGFPNVFIEAMHFGLPIVSTDVGGCNELVHEGKTGFLVTPKDEDAMANRLQKLAGDEELRKTMSEASVQASEQYDLTVVVDRFIDLYRSLSPKTP